MAVKKFKQIVEGVTGTSKKVSVLSDAMRNADNLKAVAKAEELLKAAEALKGAEAAKAAEALKAATKADDIFSAARYENRLMDASDDAINWFNNKLNDQLKLTRGATQTVGDTRKALGIPVTPPAPSLPNLRVGGMVSEPIDAARIAQEAAQARAPFTAQVLPGLTGNVTDAFSKPAQALKTKEDVFNLLNRRIQAPRFGTPEDYMRMEALAKDPNFQEMFKKGDDMFLQGARILDNSSNTQFENAMYNPARYPHQRSKEFAEFRRNFSRTPAFDKTGLKGNTAAFTTREFPGGVLDSNYAMQGNIQNLMDKGFLSETAMDYISKNGIPNLFETGLDQSILKMIKEGPSLGKAMMVMDEVMVKYMLTDPQFVREFTEIGGKIPYGFSLIPKSTLIDKLKKMAFYAHDKTGYLLGAEILDSMGGNLLINDHVLDLLSIMGEPKTADLMLVIFDKFNKVFKTSKLMTIGNLWRNMSGNLLNTTLSGMPVRKWMQYRPKAADTLKNGYELVRKSVTGEITSFSNTDIETLDLFRDFVKNGLLDMSYGKLDIPENMLEAMDKVKKGEKVTKFQELLSFFGNKNYEEDLLQRMTVFMYAKENPQAYMRLGLYTPADFVRYSLFDPNDLTQFEKDVMRRIMPFYVWAKKNIVYHMKNFSQNPNAYYRVAKGYDGIWEAVDIDPNTDIEEYKRANMWIPILVQKDGKYVAIKMNTPLGDFGEFITNPFTKILSATAAPIRAPFELATNTQILTGLPIEEFQGQKGYNLEFLPRKLDYLLSQTGLDVPIGGAARAGQAAVGIATGQMNVGEALVKSPLRSVLSQGDVARTRRAYDYQKLNRIRETMRYYKQEGIDIPTIAEIENQQKNNYYNRMRTRLMKYK